MLQYIFANISPQKCDIIVTAGNPCSNFNRACALQCAELGLKMHLIAYTEHPDEFKRSVNFSICQLCDSKITICNKSEVADTINHIMSEYDYLGIKAINIYGGGRCLEGIYSYYDAVNELFSQLPPEIVIDNIFLPCGTGTTVSGICAAFQEHSPSTKIHAISIARDAETEIPIIQENINWLSNYLNREFDLSNLIYHEEFIMGEYGQASKALTDIIRTTISTHGLLLDPIYSGKAFYGMTQILADLKDNSTNLFWHTGAIYTLLSNIDYFNNGSANITNPDGN